MNPRRADFERFVADSSDTLLRTAYLIVWDLGDAEDLVQETLLEVARRWPRIGRMEHPIAYARRILVNRALSGSARRTRRRQELIAPMPSEPEAAPDGTADIGAADELMDALAALPPRQRAVLVLRYFLDLPEAEVAAALKCSLSTVKSTASRGLARLEQAMRPAAAVATLAVIISLGAGASNAFAGWTAKPTKPAPGQLAAAGAACQHSQSSVAGVPLALADTRGPFTFAVYANSESTISCIQGPPFVALSQSQSSSPEKVPADQLRLASMHRADRHGQAFGFAYGRTGTGVSAVTLVLDDGTKVQATVANGWFIAWWPGAHQLESAELTTSAGSSTQKFDVPSLPGRCNTNKDCPNGGAVQDMNGAGGHAKGESLSSSQ